MLQTYCKNSFLAGSVGRFVCRSPDLEQSTVKVIKLTEEEVVKEPLKLVPFDDWSTYLPPPPKNISPSETSA